MSGWVQWKWGQRGSGYGTDKYHNDWWSNWHASQTRGWNAHSSQRRRGRQQQWLQCRACGHYVPKSKGFLLCLCGEAFPTDEKQDETISPARAEVQAEQESAVQAGATGAPAEAAGLQHAATTAPAEGAPWSKAQSDEMASLITAMSKLTGRDVGSLLVSHLALPPRVEEKERTTEPAMFQAFRTARAAQSKAAQNKQSADKALQKAKAAVDAAQTRCDDAHLADEKAEAQLKECKAKYFQSFPEQAKEAVARETTARTAAESALGTAAPDAEPSGPAPQAAPSQEVEDDDDPMGFRQQPHPQQEERPPPQAVRPQLQQRASAKASAQPREERGSRSPPPRPSTQATAVGCESNHRQQPANERGPPDGWDCSATGVRNEYSGGGWGTPSLWSDQG